MKAYEYILTKQIQWALNNNKKLTGSKGKRGRPAYTQNLDDNLFKPLLPQAHKSFEKGDGNEIKGTDDNPSKMQALHSSSALGVNIFQYWQKINKFDEISSACGFCRKGSNVTKEIKFEDKFEIDKKFSYDPNIDVVFHNAGSYKYKYFAVECKFSEAYGSYRHSGLKEAYLKIPDLWNDIPSIHRLAKTISPGDKDCEFLHRAQLIKHILGLKNQCGKSGFRLLYLWYDVLGEEGAAHRKEIEDFEKIVRSDGIKFHALSYQELIVKLSKEYRDDHTHYIKYLTERYL